MGRPKLLRVDERGSSWGTLPKQWHTQWEKLIEWMDTGVCRPLFRFARFPPLIFPCLVYSLGSLFGRFTCVGPSGIRFKVSVNLALGAKAFACQNPE